MNFLPLLLAAVAVLLSAGAFLLALRSSRGARDAEASARETSLAGDVARMGRQLDSIQEAVVRMPEALESVGAGISRLPSVLEARADLLKESLDALPARIAQASGASDALAALREGRDGSLQSLERLEAVRSEVKASSVAQAQSSRELAAAIAGLEGVFGQNLTATRESAQAVASALSAAAEGSAAGATGQAETLGAISRTLEELSGLVGSAVDRLGSSGQGDLLGQQLEALRLSNDLARANGARLEEAGEALGRLVAAQASALEQHSQDRTASLEAGSELREAIERASRTLAEESSKSRELLQALPVRTAEEIASRPAPAPELEELAIAVRDAGALRGDSVRSIADAVSRVAERLEASAEDGRSARQDAADRLSQSLAALEAVASGVREALLPLGDALRGHGEAVVPVVKSLEAAQDRLEEAAVSLRVNQVEFAASVGVFTSAAQDLSTGLGAFAREGLEDASRDPAAVQLALLESLDRLLGGFSDSLRATLVEADLRHREALVEIAARLPDGTKG